MKNDSFPMTKLLKIAGCLLFDIAILLAFYHGFALFTILEPGKSSLMLFVLLIGLGVVNAAIIVPDQLARRFGIVHTTSIVLVSFLYAIIANLLSAFLIAGSVFWYIVWELIIFSLFVFSLSVIHFFAQRTAQDQERDSFERAHSQSVLIQLIDIERSLQSKQGDTKLLPVLKSFKELKERIQASTPFGRIANNHQVAEIEQTVQSNLEYILLQSKLDNIEPELDTIQRMLDETRRLIMNRELLNIK